MTDKSDIAILAEFQERRQAFDPLCGRLWNRFGQPYEVFNRCTCPVCGYPTLSVRSSYDMCSLCDWEDDGQDDEEADEVWGGPNGDYSLTEARLNFARFGSMYRPEDRSDSERVRKRLPHNERLRHMYEVLLNVGDSHELADLILKVKRFEGVATSLEEHLSRKPINYEQRKGVILNKWWIGHPVWEGTPYGHGRMTPHDALGCSQLRFGRMRDVCDRLRTELEGRFDRRPCPACGLPTLEGDISSACRLCGWDREVPTNSEPDRIMGGLRGDYSLTEARLSFEKHLTMFRPGDEPDFSRSQQNILKKCLLIRAYLELDGGIFRIAERLDKVFELEKEGFAA